MLRKGQRIRELTKKVGQMPRRGVVVDIRGETVEVKWEDGHTSTLSGSMLVADKPASH